MHPELTQRINAQRNKEMRNQAAAWRRAAESRGAARHAGIHLAAFARLARSPQSVPGLKPPQRRATT